MGRPPDWALVLPYSARLGSSYDKVRRRSDYLTGPITIYLLVHPTPTHIFYSVDKTAERPVYLQLSDLVIRHVRWGALAPGARLPATRTLARELGVNRNTVVAGYADAADQGYLEGRAGSGVFVRSELPVVPAYGTSAVQVSAGARAGFSFASRTPCDHSPSPPTMLRFTEGSPGVRLADLRPLYATARKLLETPSGKTLLRYGDGRGDIRLREVLAGYLGRT